MNVFAREEAKLIAATAEAIIMMLDESYIDEWLGSNELTYELILEIAELLYDREIDSYDIFEYFKEYDNIDDILSYDIREEGEDFIINF